MFQKSWSLNLIRFEKMIPIYDTWVMKLDKNGKIQWQNMYGDTICEVAGGITQVSDGGYIFTVPSGSSQSGDVNATIAAYQDDNITAKAITKTLDQMNKDQFPGVGHMEPDGDSNSRNESQLNWNCRSGAEW